MKEYARKVRINTQLRAELSVLVRSELSDPRVAGVTVTSVDVSPDLRNARVAVSLLGDDAQLAEAVKGLNRAGGRLRARLGGRLRLRYVPELRFVPDVALRESDHLNALIHEAVRSDAAKHGASSGDDSAQED